MKITLVEVIMFAVGLKRWFLLKTPDMAVALLANPRDLQFGWFLLPVWFQA